MNYKKKCNLLYAQCSQIIFIKLSAMSEKLLKTLNCIPKMFLNFMKDIMKHVYWPVSSFFYRLMCQCNKSIHITEVVLEKITISEPMDV